jgi:hypothetical protein
MTWRSRRDRFSRDAQRRRQVARGGAARVGISPIAGLNGHPQLFSGFIDYDHRQTTMGPGVSFFD